MEVAANYTALYLFAAVCLLLMLGYPVAFTLAGTALLFAAGGILFGNFNALAMEPLGHMAGLGAAFVGSLSTFISLPLGWAIGYKFDNTVIPLVAGFAILGAVSLAVMWWTERGTAVQAGIASR